MWTASEWYPFLKTLNFRTKILLNTRIILGELKKQKIQQIKLMDESDVDH